MTAKTVVIGVALVLVGCAPEISGNAETVRVPARFANPYAQATEHCAKHGKIAKTPSQLVDRWFFGSNIYYVYKCQ